MTTYAIDYVLGYKRFILIVRASDPDDAFDKVRTTLRDAGFIQGSLQGTARVASQSDVDGATLGVAVADFNDL